MYGRALSFGLGLLLVAACGAESEPAVRVDVGPDTNDSADGDVPGDATNETPLDAASPADQVCDGKAGVSLALYMEPQHERSEGAAVTDELGAGFAYVDGSCQFWVWQTREVAAFRTGKLGREELEAMLADLAFDEWNGLEGVGLGGPDASAHVFYSRDRAFACAGGCPSSPLPMQQAFAAGIRWRTSLWEKGTPMSDAAMRVAPYAEEAEDPTVAHGQVATPWPFGVSPADLQLWVDRPSEPGTGYLVTDPETVAAVRRERDNAAQRIYNSTLWFGPYEGRYYGFGAREVLPMEDARGLMPRPAVISEWWPE
jgi:hypothetical protein